MRRLRLAAVTLALGAMLAAAPVALAQTVSGQVFEDRNANGILDPGEPLLQGFAVELYGQSDLQGAVDTSVATDAAGGFSFSPGNGNYLLRPVVPADWRASMTRFDSFSRSLFPDPTDPVGQPRFGRLEGAIQKLRAGSLRYTAMGDSIATNFDWCDNIFGNFLYSTRVRDRLNCTTAGTPVSLPEVSSDTSSAA